MKNYELCKELTFSDCELAILRTAVDKAEEIQGRQTANSPEVKSIINIVENFFKKKTSSLLWRSKYKRTLTKTRPIL